MARKKTPVLQKENKAVAKYEPTDQERELRMALRAAIAAKPPTPAVKVNQGKIEMDHLDSGMGWAILVKSLGTTSIDFSVAILNQLNSAFSKGKEPDPAAINFAFAVIAGIKPRDELETMLATQMAAIHAATMTQARRLANSETIPQQDSNERALNKLARTFATQMETLKRYRTGGEQKVTVHHVTVNDGGQAIVGTVEQSNDRREG
ncbi:hypothetical protein [uncultured Desulfobulbus sp.]|uniref:hypothetical protein n=1 Tax=uncultured Desulfobulbus sp. TaxID=239745 RepID=UPI0029C8411E|nr:hypothetical protein [uncultured Desulfobulbus sp.]